MRKIDIGCGKKPQKGYDAYTDVYMSGVINADPELKKKFTLTPAEDMSMFKDKEFDWVNMNHVIEHVNDPSKACSEIVRIAKAGTLRFPSPQAEILFGRRDHKWIVFPDYNRKHLFFIAKRFASYYTPSTVPKDARACSPLQQDPFNWEGSFTWTVAR